MPFSLERPASNIEEADEWMINSPRRGGGAKGEQVVEIDTDIKFNHETDECGNRLTIVHD